MNNLLQVLLSSFTNQSSVDATSQKTGVKGVSVLTILSYALPLIIKFMTKNASNTNGAQSLLGALTQHRSTKAMPEQIAEADVNDGAAIMRHIFGDSEQSAVEEIATKANVPAADVTSVLASIAPTLLSSLSAAATAGSQAQANQKKGVDLSDGLDVSDLAAIFQSTQSGSGIGGILGTLLGGTTQQSASAKDDGTALLSSLLSLMK
ncbi:MAG: DUF937 domain-containing protein [Erysipelotrichaceae bacterium]|nr:DUF937 domain-containing protein [Erysipelotrichaceae bacterium]